MPTNIFKQAVAAATSRPKGVVVSLDLFRALNAEQAIERKLATPGGLPAPAFGIELPYYDGDIFVACDPLLVDFNYKLPSS
ncbi:hypothetical protein D3C87_1797440 [compost metagenome]